MPIILLRALIVLATSAIALWVASLILGDDVELKPLGIITASVIFTVVFLLLTPLASSLLKQYAEGVVALTGLLVVFVSLLVTDLISDNLDIVGWFTWVLATVIVWLAVIVVRFLLGAVFKDRLAQD
jgi:hypothetical protein